MKLSVIAPVLNEFPWIGYSIMAAEPYVEEFIYALDEKSNDGTRELLRYVKEKYLHERLVVLDHPTFHPSDTIPYNRAFNVCIDKMKGDAAFFLHPDMIITGAPKEGIPPHALAWWTTITSYAGDLQTVITKGRADKWKNIHAKKFGLHYYGSYGSQNEDFYHRDITGKSYKHFGTELSKYPYQIADSGITINHYCELKDYARRLEKMKLCLKTLYPNMTEEALTDAAIQHPRVTLEPSCNRFGNFVFEKKDVKLPEVFSKHKEEFESIKKEVSIV